MAAIQRKRRCALELVLPMTIYGMMRVKNEARWIERVIESQLQACEKLFILDDHSTDGTPDLCGKYNQVNIFRSPFVGLQETRDKNWLLEQIEREAKPGDWILAIDGDEELEPGGCDKIRALTLSRPNHDTYRFQVFYLWDRPDQVRVDGVYKEFWRPSLFRLTPGRRFISENGGGFHCGNCPDPGSIGNCKIRLLHYGYMMREDRIRKFEWYNAPDKQPVPEIEDGYRHMVLGDILPSNTVTRWAGPLELRPL